jgi:hypothetical protein
MYAYDIQEDVRPMNRTMQKAIRAEYSILRAPLAVLDERVISRLEETSRVRSTFERGLQSLDTVAARLLEPTPARSQPLPREEQDEIHQLTDTLLAEQEEQTFVGELADDELRRVQAELRAKHRIEEQHGQ